MCTLWRKSPSSIGLQHSKNGCHNWTHTRSSNQRASQFHSVYPSHNNQRSSIHHAPQITWSFPKHGAKTTRLTLKANIIVVESILRCMQWSHLTFYLHKTHMHHITYWGWHDVKHKSCKSHNQCHNMLIAHATTTMQPPQLTHASLHIKACNYHDMGCTRKEYELL